jgi:hypothetical protein
MAKTIEPIFSWQNGEEKQATVFVLTSSFDNLSTNANFQYQLNELSINPTPPTPDYYSFNTLVNGLLSISGQDYLDWDTSSDANNWIYNWAAAQLKLTITGDFIPPVPSTTTTTTTEAPTTTTTTEAPATTTSTTEAPVITTSTTEAP